MSLATRRLYRTADDRVVFEGDTDAAFLLCPEGAEIPEGFEEPTEPTEEPEVKPVPKKAPAKKAAEKPEPDKADD